MSTLKHKFRQIKKLPAWIYFLPALLIRTFFKLFYRVQLIDPANVCSNPERMVVVIWHNRLIFLPLAFPYALRKNTFAMVSASRDGQYLSDFLSHFSVRTLRGSSSRKGMNALLGAVRVLEDNKTVVITPDGPRGPKYKLKNGPIMLASRTGARIVPLAINASKCWKLKSWDNFQIPKPGAKLTVIIGEPITVPPGLTPEQLQAFKEKAESELIKITVDPA